MRVILIGVLAAVMLSGSMACSWIGFGSAEDIPEKSSTTPDINATITAGIATAVAKQEAPTEAAAPTQSKTTSTPVSSSGQANWLDGLSQFHRIKVARDEVECVGYDSGRFTSSHDIIKVDDGFYAIGNPGEAVVFFDNNSGCRIGVITDENLE